MNTVVGIELGQRYVRLVEIEKRWRWFKLRNYQRIERQQLEKSVDRAVVRTRVAAVALPSALVTTHFFQVARTFTQEDISLQCEAEIEAFLGYPLEEIVFDFQVLGSLIEAPEAKEVLCVAARKAEVDRLVQQLAVAGFSVHLVTSESFAAARTFSLVQKEPFKTFLEKSPDFSIACGLAFLALEQGRGSWRSG